jgi:hypothetical protein
VAQALRGQFLNHHLQQQQQQQQFCVWVMA